MNFNLSNEIYEELTSNKYPTLFEIEIGGKEKIRAVRYDDYKKLENIIKEVREYIEEKEKDDDNWIDYELCIEPIVIKEILDKVGSDKK